MAYYEKEVRLVELLETDGIIMCHLLNERGVKLDHGESADIEVDDWIINVTVREYKDELQYIYFVKRAP